jgi:hypothetical protein
VSDPQGSIRAVKGEMAAPRKLPGILEYSVRSWQESVGKEFLKAALPHASMKAAMPTDRAELAREGKQGTLSGVIERLLPEPISGEKKLPAPPVQDRERKHTIKTRREFLAPLLESVDENFSIRVVCPEDVTARLERPAKILMIVDLTIENNADRLILIPHRLGATFDVNDR